MPDLTRSKQALEVLLQVLLVVRRRLSVHARRAVLARAPVGFAQPVDVDVVGQAHEGPLRLFPRQFCYPLKFR